MRNMALLQAFYLHDYSAAISTLETAIRSVNNYPAFRDQCKLDMGDIYILKDEPWESTLLYMQVEKSQKEDNLAEIARLKNAKLQYYTGQFALSKDILDILKNLEAEEAVLSMNTSLSPVCVTCADEPDYTYIVTPVRVVF